MTFRSRIATLLVLGAMASGGLGLALTGVAHAQSNFTPCPQSSAESTYAGEGAQVTPFQCEPRTSPGPSLPFTGLDLGLLVAAALVLIAGGTVLRLRLRHGDE
jgi:hypothetical protein